MFYNIIADNHSFFISKATLDNHPTCLITQVINNYCSDDKIFVDNNKIYIDMDGESISVIIDFLRSYIINGIVIKNNMLIEKVHRDATFLGLSELAEELQEYLPITNTSVDKSLLTNLILNISDNFLNINSDEFKNSMNAYLNSPEGDMILNKLYIKTQRTTSTNPEISLFIMILLKFSSSRSLLKTSKNENHLHKVSNYKNIIKVLSDLVNNDTEDYIDDQLSSIDSESFGSLNEDIEKSSIATDTEYDSDGLYTTEYINID